MPTIDQQIEALQKKLKQAKARKARADARLKAAEKKRTRQQDTRRKILAGSMVLDMMERDEQTRSRIIDRLDKHLTRDDDRALFDLPLLPKDTK